MLQISRKGAIFSAKIKQFETVEGLWSFSTASLGEKVSLRRVFDELHYLW
ncbi:hypothetical protein MARINON1_52325 [Marinobacter salarius]|jgi:hypothetical protein|nr:hypothetical protein MBHK15_110422 [Marinobacter salarius]VXC19755.1 hypothetical protein MARINON1_52325 [Marinobacter salarius]